MRVLSNPKHLLFIFLLLITTYLAAEAQNPHDIYDLRVGVERYYTGCFQLPELIACGLSYYTYRLDRVIGTKIFDEKEFAVIENIVISNQEWIVSRDTSYQRVEGNELLQLNKTDSSYEGMIIYRFNFVTGDSVTSHIRNLETENEYYQMKNLSVISADTTATFPDGQSYRVVFGSDGTYPWNNSQLIEELSDVWSNTIVNQGTLGSNKIGLNWLVPFTNIKSAQYETDFFPGIHTFFHVSRFGPILSMTFSGWRYLAGFKSHDGQIYGYFHDGIPVGIDRNDGSVTGYRLLRNYPNPFNPSTVIEFELPEANHVRLAVYDQLGREIALLINEILPSGRHQTSFDGQNLSSGIYVYRLQSGDHLLTGKMVLMK